MKIILLGKNSPEDLKNQTAEISAECFGKLYGRDYINTALENPLYKIYIAVENNNISGYITILSAAENECEIEHIAVKPSERGKGIGTKLMSLTDDYNKIFLEVRISNRNAINLYEHCGFVQGRTRKNYYHYPTEDAIEYYKEN